MSDKDRTYAQRNDGRTNLAEDCAEEYFKREKFKYVRYGFDEKCGRVDSDIWWKMPEEIRSAPDYIVVNDVTVFFEVKGYVGTLKIKINDMVAYEHWSKILPVMMFVRNCGTHKEYSVEWKKVIEHMSKCEVGHYTDNGRTYFIIDEAFLEKENMIRSKNG
jgi:mRNA-degrading endonuclease HigB of HigAB toxin-antitoxin module